MRRVFNDDDLQKQIEDKGYVVVPFLNEEDVIEMKALHNKHFSKLEYWPGGLYITIFEKDDDIKSDTNFAIRNKTSKKCAELLDNYKSVNSSFAIKLPMELSLKELHQDLTVTDETKYTSLILWAPLLDVDENNGCIWAVEGSHDYFGIRPRQNRYFHPFDYIKDHIWKHHAVPVRMKAGEALILDCRLIHGSLPNFSDEPRVAVLNVMAPEESPTWVCFGKPENNDDIQYVDVFEFAEDNYFLQDVSRTPDFLPGVSKVNTMKLERCNITESEFDALINEQKK